MWTLLDVSPAFAYELERAYPMQVSSAGWDYLQIIRSYAAQEYPGRWFIAANEEVDGGDHLPNTLRLQTADRLQDKKQDKPTYNERYLFSRLGLSPFVGGALLINVLAPNPPTRMLVPVGFARRCTVELHQLSIG